MPVPVSAPRGPSKLLPLALASALLALAACGGDGVETDFDLLPGEPPEQPRDAGPLDAGGALDGGARDAGAPDAGARDAGSPDAGLPDAGLPDAGTPDAGLPDAGTGTGAGWLRTEGHRILRADGSVWQGRGANVHDTRSCNACTFSAPNVGEVKRRIDELVSWGATFIRLDLESYPTQDGRLHWRGVLEDPAYFADVREIVRHVGTKPGVYVMVSLWHDPSIDANGWPTAQTQAVWRALAQAFLGQSHVLFGLVNEPENNFDGAQDAQVWRAMNDTVAAIRAVEDAAGSPRHLVAVQGTGGWARRLAYYSLFPITAGGGENVVYEVHVYDPTQRFDELFVQPAKSLPVIIGEFGPAEGYMSEADSASLITQADALQVPWLAWSLHMRCAPNLLEDYSGGGCGVGMPLTPTSWGALLRSRLAAPPAR